MEHLLVSLGFSLFFSENAVVRQVEEVVDGEILGGGDGEKVFVNGQGRFESHVFPYTAFQRCFNTFHYLYRNLRERGEGAREKGRRSGGEKKEMKRGSKRDGFVL